MLGSATVRNVLSVLVDVNDDLSPAPFLSCTSAQPKSTQVDVPGQQLMCHRNIGGKKIKNKKSPRTAHCFLSLSCTYSPIMYGDV